MTTVPRPLTAKTRSIARRAAGGSTADRAAGTRRAAPTSAARTSSRPSPTCRRDRQRPGSRRGSSREQSAPRRSRHLGRAERPTRSVFVTTARPSPIPSASSSSRCSSVWARGPSSAATTSSAASISPAPTSMLPTRRSWPGTSTKSIADAVGQAQVGVPDVDRHAAPPLLRQPVGVDAGQRAQEGGLAVVDVAGRADDDGHAGVGRPRRRRGASARAKAAARRRSSDGLDRPQVEHDARRPRSGRSTAGSPPQPRPRATSPRGRRPSDRDAGRRERLARAATRRRPSLDRGQRPVRGPRPAARPSDPLRPVPQTSSGVAAIIRQTGISVVARPGPVERRGSPRARRASSCRAASRGRAGPSGCGR